MAYAQYNCFSQHRITLVTARVVHQTCCSQERGIIKWKSGRSTRTVLLVKAAYEVARARGCLNDRVMHCKRIRALVELASEGTTHRRIHAVSFICSPRMTERSCYEVLCSSVFPLHRQSLFALLFTALNIFMFSIDCYGPTRDEHLFLCRFSFSFNVVVSSPTSVSQSTWVEKWWENNYQFVTATRLFCFSIVEVTSELGSDHVHVVLHVVRWRNFSDGRVSSWKVWYLKLNRGRQPPYSAYTFKKLKKVKGMSEHANESARFIGNSASLRSSPPLVS